MRDRTLPVLLALVVAGATLAAFRTGLEGGIVRWDDPGRLVRHTEYRALGAENVAWMFSTKAIATYEPVAWLTHAVEWQIWGDSDDFRPYRRLGWLLHAASASLLYALLARLARRTCPWASPAQRHLSAAGAALVFALHPLRVEPVVWLSCRGYPPALFFALVSTLLYLERGESKLLLAGSMAAFVLAMLSKSVAVGLPVAFLAIDGAVLGRLRTGVRRCVLEKLPYLVLAALVLWMAYRAKREASMIPLTESSIGLRLALVGRAPWLYAWKTIVPTGLVPIYPLDPSMGILDPLSFVAFAATLGLTAQAVLRPRRAPWFSAAWIASLALLAPVSGIVQSGEQAFADRYTLLPMVPWTAVLAVGLCRASRPRVGRAPLAALVVAVLAALGFLTHRQGRVWRDTETLWSHTLDVDPGNRVAHAQLGQSALEAQRPRVALEHFTGALESYPKYGPALLGRGLSRDRLGDPYGALADYDAAVEQDAGIAERRYSRGVLRARLGRNREAREDLDAAIALDPRDVDAWVHRGALSAVEGDVAGAVRDFDRAVEIEPGDVRARGCLEDALEVAVEASTEPDRSAYAAHLRDVRHPRPAAPSAAPTRIEVAPWLAWSIAALGAASAATLVLLGPAYRLVRR